MQLFQTHHRLTLFNPFTSKISLVILLTVCHTIHCLFIIYLFIYLFNSFIGYVYKLKMNTYTRKETKNGQTYTKRVSANGTWSPMRGATLNKNEEKKKKKKKKRMDVSFENLVLDQLIILSQSFDLITCLLDIVLILQGGIISCMVTQGNSPFYSCMLGSKQYSLQLPNI